MVIPLSKQDLLDIVAAASTLDERLDKEFLPDDVRANDEMVNARLDAWCQTIARGDWEQFRRRLAWDGHTEEMVRRVLDAVRMPEGAPLPAWAETLSEVLRLAASLPTDELGMSQTKEGRLPFLDAKEPFPFEEILVPFVLLAQRQYALRAGDTYGLLCHETHVVLQRNLLQMLTSYAAQALYLEFSIERAQTQSPLDYFLTAVQEHDQQTYYQQFVMRMRRGGLIPFFQEYTVLARLLATITDMWVEATVEFLQRLAADWLDIQQMFGSESEPGQVTSVEPSLSDPHRGRRMVMALTLASGRKVVYKPKDLGTEEVYYRLLAWCNERGAPLTLKVLTVLNRSSHGWVEFVEHEPCKDREEAQHYYRRAGMLLCLMYILEGTDCHYENIIACGEHPILVDLETLMHPRPRFEDEGEGVQAQMLAHDQMTHSVLHSGLMPNWRVADDGRATYDASGLGSISEQELSVQASRWIHINTDHMTLEYSPVKMQIQRNRPLLNGVPLQLEDYGADVIEGFQQMYGFLLEQRKALLAAENPLHELADQQVRFVYRATRIYGVLARKLLAPKYLRDGIDRSIQLELLGRAMLPLEGPLRDKGERTRWWPVFAIERQAMAQGDTPFFTARTSSDALIVAPGQQIKACFEYSSFDLVVTRLKSLDDEDLEQQVVLIQGSLYAHNARDVVEVPIVNGTRLGASPQRGEKRSSERLVAQALAIADQIARRAIRASDGSAAWIAPYSLVQAGRYQLQPMGYDLYSGTCGIGMFLAALEKVTDGAGYRELALGTVQSLRHTLRDYGQRTVRDMGIGGASGLGSVIYALARMSQWLDEPALLVDAAQAAKLLTTECIAHDKALDVIAGASGAILGLLSLFDASYDEAIVERAITCGQHLLQARTESKAGLRAWSTFDGKMLTGFSHGAAGIVYTLLRLYAVTRDGDLLAAAQEGIAYEDSMFVPEASNWPDLRAEEPPTFMTSWCHGAPGIGLARIAGLPMLDTPNIRRDIETAMQTTQAFGIQHVDYLCCGNLGRVDVLLAAANRLSRPDLAELANTWAWQIVTRAEEMGEFTLHPLRPKGVYSLGFFQGTAGIGYELLRIAHPDALPSVLLWE